MKIIPRITQNINNVNNISLKSIWHKKPLTQDVVCFSTPQTDTDWKELVPKLNSYITKNNFLGSGSEAKVYKLNDKYVLRLYGGTKTVKPQQFNPLADIFEGRNFGQPVAMSSDKSVSINKLVSGKHLYKVNGTDEKAYMESLRKYSELPDEVLEDFVENVAFLNSKGYRIDEGNPENFLYDEAKQKIGIVDICKKGSSSLDLFGPYSHYWILDPLANGHDYAEMYKKLDLPERKEMIELILKLEDRIKPMCKKHGIPVITAQREDYTLFDLPLFLAKLDKFDVNSSEGIITQMAKMEDPERLKCFKDWDYTS